MIQHLNIRNPKILLAILAICNVNLAEQYHDRELTPKSIGTIHQDAFDQLGELYSSEKPSSHEDVITDIANFVSSFCPKADSNCVSNVYKTTVEQSHSTQRRLDERLYSDNLDVKVKGILDNVYITIDLIEKDNINDIVDKLDNIQSQLEKLENIDERSRMVGIASLSVAIESSKLWHSAYIDITHPLHKMIGYFYEEGLINRRNLQASAFDTSPIAQAVRPDIRAAAVSDVSRPLDFIQIIASSITASFTGVIVSSPVILDLDDISKSYVGDKGPLQAIIQFFRDIMRGDDVTVSAPIILDIDIDDV